MCGLYSCDTKFNQWNKQWRHTDPVRLNRIKQYAKKRWWNTKNLRHSRRWLGIIESVDSRNPR